ncbi:putative disease resistance RPP13-like protein 1 [Acorus calamus]|uniref:Disease resistance RPP13-like protein 1 n=1 Tax=Acorus calamus TaxID=4465 RepID=A0AAV9EUM2_ACOCL|nr:putative disease resistance RPP13-like protein 1 [Acorus calamus]
MIIPSVFTDEILKKLVELVEQEWVLLWGVKDELMKLKDKLSKIKNVLQDAENKEFQDHAVRDWLIELKDTMYDIEDIMDDCSFAIHVNNTSSTAKPKSSPSCFCSTTPFKKCKRIISKKMSAFYKKGKGVAHRHEIGKRIEKINVRLEEIHKDRQRLQLVQTVRIEGSPLSLQTATSAFHRPETTSWFIESEVFGINEDADRLVQSLTKPNKEEGGRVFAIVGMGGIGKTTLAQKVYNKDLIKSHFEKMAWVCVSQVFDEIKVLKQLVESARDKNQSEEDKPSSVGSRKCLEALSKDQLYNNLKTLLGGKRILLVLDDLWSNQVWEECLRVPFHCFCNQDSRVLITTRNGEIARQMGAVYTHQMELLSDNDGFSLLCKVVSGGRDSMEIDQSMKDVGMKIVEKCKGLPLAIRAIGGILNKRKVTESAWKLVLSSAMWSNPSLEVETVLQFSYLDLPPYLKPCFLYCTLFPEDYKITRTKLSRMWIAEGFVKAEGELLMEDLADSYYEELITRSLLQVVHVSTIGCSIVEDIVCQMHDLVRERAISIAQGKHIYCHLQGSKVLSQKPRRSSTIAGVESVKGLKYIPLRSLLGFDKTSREIPQDLFGKLRYLRVLDLSMIFIEQLPDSIGKLVQLRYLDLSFSKIVELPDSLCNLQYLQTLNLTALVIFSVKLPNCLRRLQELRHLNVQKMHLLDEDHDVIVPAGIGELVHLQTLNRFTIHDNSNKDDEGGCSNIHELGSLSRLKILKIFGLNMIQSGAEAKKAKIKDKARLRTLELWWDRRDNQLEYESRPDVGEMKRVVEVFEELCPPPSLQELYVNGFYAQELPSWMRLPSYSLQNLVYLRLNFIWYLEQLPSLGHLPNLERLHISKNEKIVNIGPKFMFGEGWRRGGVGISRFPKLDTLSFRWMLGWEE